MTIDCKTSLKCMECESDKHTSATHSGSAPWSFVGQAEHSPEAKQSRVSEDLSL